MPEPSKLFEEMMTSPSTNSEELIVMFEDDSIMGERVKSENCDDESRQDIEIIDPSQTFTKPPTVRTTKSNTSKEQRPIPPLKLVNNFF